MTPPRPEHDRGSTTAFTVVLTTALLACAGLVLDGGLALTARVRAVALAQEAARAGAQDVDLAAYRTTGRVVLQPRTAEATARTYLAAAAVAGDVTTTAGTVTVTVDIAQPTRLLTVIGITTIPVHGHATAAARPLSSGAAP